MEKVIIKNCVYKEEVVKEKAINKFGKDLDRAKIVKKDVNSPWWKQVKGYWI